MTLFEPGADTNTISLTMRTEHHFAGVTLVPYLVQENYIHMPGVEQSLEALAVTAESISGGEISKAVAKSAQYWKVMTTYVFLLALQSRGTLAGVPDTMVQFLSFRGVLSIGASGYNLFMVENRKYRRHVLRL